MEQDAVTGRGGPRFAPAARMILGAVWIIDAVLQAQPRMFGRELVTDMILPAGSGQPAPVAWSITSLGHLILPDPAVWNALFVVVQLAIGIALLRRSTARAGLIGTVAWSLAVWWLGEGFGMILTGTASPFTGAPGAALLYAVVAVVLWPAVDDEVDHRSSVASRAMVAWFVLWALSAVLWVLPVNRSTGAFHRALLEASGGQPHWYGSFLGSLANHLSGQGPGLALTLALVSLIIGFAPLLVRRAVPVVVVGMALQVGMWVTGQGIGSVFTGMGTDVGTAPLMCVLGFLVVGLARARVESPSVRLLVAPGTAGLRARVGVAATGLALLVVGTYPVAARASTASGPQGSMSSMAGMASTGQGTPAAPSHGAAPASSMAGMGGDTDPTWTYVGPPLASREVTLLDAVYAATEKGHAMQTPTCTAPPTAAQAHAAADLVQRTTAAVARYRDLSAAKADGYVPVTSPLYPVVHYEKPANMGQSFVLDPDHVQSLVYAHTPQGWVLAAAMYLMPKPGMDGPMPGGCLTQWHSHTNLCTSLDTHVISGFAPCPVGMVQTPTPEMLHVWQVPVPGGTLAMDPSDLQVVQGAVMAQESGDAPVGMTGP